MHYKEVQLHNKYFADCTFFTASLTALKSTFKLLLCRRLYFLCNKTRVNQYLMRSQLDPFYSLDFGFFC